MKLLEVVLQQVSILVCSTPLLLPPVARHLYLFVNWN